jgi:hypothetical protein
MGGWWFFGFLIFCIALGIPLAVHMMRADDRHMSTPASRQGTPLDPAEDRRQTPGGAMPYSGA